MKPARRPRVLPLGLVLGFALGFALLAAGLVALLGLFVDERDSARARVDREQSALAERAAAHLRQTLTDLAGSLDDAIGAALTDPLRPHDPLLLVERDGTVRLPSRAAPADSEVRPLLTHLDAADEAALARLSADDPPLAERLRLVAALPATTARWLEHRRHFVLRADRELATTLFALERLAATSALDPTQADALLRTAEDAFFPALLRARPRLSAADLEHLLERAATLARRMLVRVDDVLARAAASAPPLPPTTALLDPALATPRLVGPWLIVHDDDRVRGRHLALDALVAETHRALALPADLTLTPTRRDGPLHALTLAASSPRWDLERAELDQRFTLKAIPLAAVALLALAVFALAIVLQKKKIAYLDLRSHLLAAVTHELKTPLASIRAMAETLELRLADHPAARDYPRRIVASSERLAFLVDNVLSFARLERGAWKPHLTPLPVSELAAWLAAEPLARAARPVDLDLDVPAELVLVADPDLVRLLLSNLLDNAARYAVAERVRVTLSARRDARGVHLSLSDDGPGLADLDPASLGAHAHPTPPHRLRGTGLGLSICRMIMALHGGSLEAASHPAGGARFTATFPAHTAPPLSQLTPAPSR